MKVRGTEVMWRVVDRKVVILDLRSSTFLTTNVTGSRLWTLLQEDIDRESLVKGLLEAYEVDEKTARADVDRFLELLQTNGLLEGDALASGTA
jgi:hypothetical protein